ncbi:hypothetical protein [Yersinia sp. Marseille-Q3913]|uniref:hypothetical protein n=1 Tax=Yersinia sp. Marseille-Q3913 TaxID=2830769 RepID=UPI001BAF688D|nr:hypothetical protein [Yersinia sp. Marseille-Q3913]MBS0056917.1 hypothetical protein [Yersinia sp. Marseille-Q3913]
MTNEKMDGMNHQTEPVCQPSTELTLSALLTERCIQFANGPQAVTIINNGIEKMLINIVNDTFHLGGLFGKQLADVFKAALPTNISNIVDLQHYNSLIIQSIRDAWATSRIEANIVERMTDLVTAFIQDGAIPKFILASELWAAFIEENHARAIEERWKTPQVIVSEFENGDYIWIGLQPEQSRQSLYSNEIKRGPHECDSMLAFSAKYHHGPDGKIVMLHDGMPVYELFAGHLENGVLGKAVINAYSRFDKLVLALYYGGSLLLWDKNPKKMKYPGND